MFGVDDAIIWPALISGAAGLIQGGMSMYGGKVQGDAAKEAAGITADASNHAVDLQKQMFDQQRADLEPWRQVGANALGQLSQLASSYQPFQFNGADPSYQFRLKEGLKAVENQAANRGGLLSGATMKAMNNYAQGAASQEYQNAFNRYQTEREVRLNPLQSLAGVGQTAVGRLGDAGQNYASNVGNLQIGTANALANGMTGAANAATSGYVGGANALSNALSTGYNNYQNQQILNRLLSNRPGTNSTLPVDGRYDVYGVNQA